MGRKRQGSIEELAAAVVADRDLLREVLRRGAFIEPQLFREALSWAKEQNMNSFQREQKVLAVGATTIDVSLNGRFFAGLVIGAGLTATALTFASQEMIDGAIAWEPVYDNNTARSRTVAPSRYLREDPSTYVGIQTLRLIFGTAQATADCNIQVITGTSIT